MVTVPLLDIRSSPDEEDQDLRIFDFANFRDKGEEGSVEDDEAFIPALDICERRASASSVTSRSTRGSSGRDSTSNGDDVDWEKLDRTEEQEPRTGPTDEVCKIDSLLTRYFGLWELISFFSLPRCCWHVWNKKTMRWRRTLSRAYQARLDLAASPALPPSTILRNLLITRAPLYDTHSSQHRQ